MLLKSIYIIIIYIWANSSRVFIFGFWYSDFSVYLLAIPNYYKGLNLYLLTLYIYLEVGQ